MIPMRSFRMRVWLLLALLMSLGPPAWAGTIVITLVGTPVTITTTVKQDKELERQTARLNTSRAQQTPPLPPLSTEQYAEQVITASLLGEAQVAGSADMVDGCAFFKAQPEGQQAATITQQFGGYPPCP